MGCLIIMALQSTLDHWLPVKPWVGSASLGRGMDSRFRGFGLCSTMGGPVDLEKWPVHPVHHVRAHLEISLQKEEDSR